MAENETPARLGDDDIRRLVDKIVSAFPNPHDLDNAVRRGTGDRLFVEYVGPNQPQRRTVEKLFDALEERGTTVFFLRGALAERPKRDDVRALVAQLYPSALVPLPVLPTAAVQQAGRPVPMPPSAEVPGLERNVRPRLQQLHVRVWVDLLARRERCVCRIERDGRPLGTGFLVGPGAVLTNWHVVEPAIARGGLDAVQCRFDYAKLPDGGTREGLLVPLHGEGVVDQSPYAPAEVTATPETPPPTADQLDYALLRLARPLGQAAAGGDAPEPGGTPRGWIALPATLPPLETGAPLLILQHPHGAPIKLALDTEAVLGVPFGGVRLRYATNTEAGSSGSPCFTMDWDLVALHHFGDPAWQAPQFNQGVPIDRIRARIDANGHGGLLGGP
jgi:hypothetical protein